MRSKILIGSLGAAVAFLLATNPLVVQAAGVITSADIVNNTIKGKDVKDNSLTGKDVKDNGLTGSDVNEGTLTKVPDADKLDGIDSSTLEPAVTVYRIAPASSTLVNGARYTMNIAPGRYMVTWRFNGFGSGTNYCWAAPNSELNAGNYTNMVSDSTNGSFQATSAAGEITIPAANDFVFECEGSNISLQAPVVITAQALSVTSSGTTGPVVRPSSQRTTP